MNRLDDLKTAILSIPGRTVAAKLRQLMPEIDRRVRDGIRHEDVVETLEQHGLHVKLGTFRKYLYRYRRNLKTSADEETKAPPPEPAPQATAAVAGQIRNKGDLTRARDVDFDLDQLAEAAKDKEQ